MSLRPTPRDALWLLLGGLLAWLALSLLGDSGHSTPPRPGATDENLALVQTLHLDLATLSAASLDLALGGDSAETQNLADKARGAARGLEQRRAILWERLHGGGSDTWEFHLKAFNQACSEAQLCNAKLLDLPDLGRRMATAALRDSLDFALLQLDSSLADLAARSHAPGAALRAIRAAGDARLGALTVRALLSDHMDAGRLPRQDSLEASMRTGIRAVQRGLSDLAGLPGLLETAELDSARQRLQRLELLRTRFIDQSRRLGDTQGRARVMVDWRLALAHSQAALDSLAEVLRSRTVPRTAGSR